jgi:hypothetical protein
MARTCRYFLNGVSPTNWGPENTAATVSSVAKSTSGFGRSRPYGQSVPRMSRTTATVFSSHLQEVHPQSSHFTDTGTLMVQGCHSRALSEMAEVIQVLVGIHTHAAIRAQQACLHSLLGSTTNPGWPSVRQVVFDACPSNRMQTALTQPFPPAPRCRQLAPLPARPKR